LVVVRMDAGRRHSLHLAPQGEVGAIVETRGHGIVCHGRAEQSHMRRGLHLSRKRGEGADVLRHMR